MDGSTATAETTLTGGTFDGQRLALALVEDGESWKLDEFVRFANFDRERMIASFSEEIAANAPAELAQCVRRRLQALSDQQIQSYLINPDPAGIKLVFGPCEEGSGSK